MIIGDMREKLGFLITIMLILWISPAHAYLGPGGGITAIGSLVGIVVATIAVVIGFVWYPIKRLLRSQKAKQSIVDRDTSGAESDDSGSRKT